LFTQIDRHFTWKKEILVLSKSLENRTYEFRLIQKRLLNRFKDKNPSALNNLDQLLSASYSSIMQISQQIEDLKVQRD